MQSQVAGQLKSVASSVRQHTAKSYKSILSQLQDIPKPQLAFKEEASPPPRVVGADAGSAVAMSCDGNKSAYRALHRGDLL
jgi:hypothetical protein